MDYIIIQAGGKGTRLQHLTRNKPKALVPVENLPMLFHLFRKYPEKNYVIIADYKKEVMRAYLAAFADVKYQIAEAEGTGTCSGIRQAIDLIPEKEPFMLVWSDLLLPKNFELPEEYQKEKLPKRDYVGISQTFPCRWKYEHGEFTEESSVDYGVAGFFLFTDKSKIAEVPKSGEFVRWMKDKKIRCKTIGLSGTKEFGILEEYNKLEQIKCRPFNKITIDGEILIKEALDAQGEKLAKRESYWYEKAKALNIPELPKIYETFPLKMEYIHGKNIYDCNLGFEEKKNILTLLVGTLKKIHASDEVPADSFSLQEAYFNKTMKRLELIQDLVPYARERQIMINGKICRNVYFYKYELEKKLEQIKLNCNKFSFIHGDCTFSNMMLRENGVPVMIDPRGYFGFTEMYGDIRYDWAKIYYSIIGNYDQFNLKRFRLDIGNSAEEGVELSIESNHWEDMEKLFFQLTEAKPHEIKLLHAVIWLSLTTYTWQDYDSVCGAFYNGLWYLEDSL